MEKQFNLNIKIDDQTKDKLKFLANLDNRTMSGYLKNLIKTEYEKQNRREEVI